MQRQRELRQRGDLLREVRNGLRREPRRGDRVVRFLLPILGHVVLGDLRQQLGFDDLIVELLGHRQRGVERFAHRRAIVLLAAFFRQRQQRPDLRLGVGRH